MEHELDEAILKATALLEHIGQLVDMADKQSVNTMMSRALYAAQDTEKYLQYALQENDGAQTR